eukprot:1565276-Rhodomonas_salina.4
MSGLGSGLPSRTPSPSRSPRSRGSGTCCAPHTSRQRTLHATPWLTQTRRRQTDRQTEIDRHGHSVHAHRESRAQDTTQQEQRGERVPGLLRRVHQPIRAQVSDPARADTRGPHVRAEPASRHDESEEEGRRVLPSLDRAKTASRGEEKERRSLMRREGGGCGTGGRGSKSRGGGRQEGEREGQYVLTPSHLAIESRLAWGKRRGGERERRVRATSAPHVPPSYDTRDSESTRRVACEPRDMLVRSARRAPPWWGSPCRRSRARSPAAKPLGSAPPWLPLAAPARSAATRPEHSRSVPHIWDGSSADLGRVVREGWVE